MAGVCKGECMERSPGDEPLTLMICHSCELSHLYLGGNLSLAEPIKGKISFLS